MTPTLLAFDTSTEHLSLALQVGGRVLSHEAAGGAQASVHLVPAVMSLLAEAGIAVTDLDAIAFGAGPGAFTGLRTACAVAQGLALGSGRPVLGIESLWAVAEDARAGRAEAADYAVAMDARMDEIYAARYAWADGLWRVVEPPCLVRAEVLQARWQSAPPQVVAGSALHAFADRLDSGVAQRLPEARPRATAMLPLATRRWHDGAAVDAAMALPLYLRDRVAQTTAEREAARGERAAVEARP